MASDSIHVRVGGPLQLHVQRQIGPDGLYENASEYIRALIRDDLKAHSQTWEWLAQKLESGMTADESDFVTVSAEDVIRRNRAR
jgi:Arc/MetJ-type ribon-helix-helix transcriptional regulator